MAGFICILVILCIALRTHTDPTLLAVSLVYSIQLLTMVQYGVRRFATTEQYLTSVERMIAYTNLDVEGTYDDAPTTTKVIAKDIDIEAGKEVEWPSAGGIDVVDLRFRYRSEAPLVLKGVRLSFPARKKTGLCGRTGSGKSSMFAALSRLYDVCGGQVIIDGVDVATIPLRDLRAAIAVIPQAPTLFSGTVRFNVDPLGERPDADILTALKEAHLLRKFGNDILDSPVEEGGRNWSTGEAQLLCLARALLLNRRICTLDEVCLSCGYFF